MVSPWYLLVIAALVIVGVFVWRWWKNKGTPFSTKPPLQEQVPLVQDTGPPIPASNNPPPMLFAVNDEGNLDLTDFNGRILDSSYGSSSKLYINLLDLASKDVSEQSGPEGQKSFSSQVGTTKYYEVGGRPFIINYTRLT